jgi:hypothetical protein
MYSRVSLRQRMMRSVLAPQVGVGGSLRVCLPVRARRSEGVDDRPRLVERSAELGRLG